VVKKASELDRAQSYKIAVEMFAPSLQSYIEVGHLALYDDFLSKRLMLKFEADGKLKNLFVLSGTAINVTKVIACIIEQTNGQLFE
jgi:seryl-tRNA synthetase